MAIYGLRRKNEQKNTSMGHKNCVPSTWSEWRDSNSRHPAPKRLGKIFLLPKRRFSYVLLRKPNFLITIIPLIPTVIFLVLVKYVVKIWKGGAKLPHLLPMESLMKVYHKI